MQVQDIPRSVVCTTLRATRWPLEAVGSVMARGQDLDSWPPMLAFEDFEATVKEKVGSLLSDDELLEDGRMTHRKVEKLRTAVQIEATSEDLAERADEDFQRRRQADEARRAEARDRAAQKAAEADRAERERQRQASARAAQQKVQVQQSEAKAQAAADKRERDARAKALATERTTLANERQALAAQKKVTQKAKAIKTTKAVRKATS